MNGYSMLEIPKLWKELPQDFVPKYVGNESSLPGSDWSVLQGSKVERVRLVFKSNEKLDLGDGYEIKGLLRNHMCFAVFRVTYVNKKGKRQVGYFTRAGCWVETGEVNNQKVVKKVEEWRQAIFSGAMVSRERLSLSELEQKQQSKLQIIQQEYLLKAAEQIKAHLESRISDIRMKKVSKAFGGAIRDLVDEAGTTTDVDRLTRLSRAFVKRRQYYHSSKVAKLARWASIFKNIVRGKGVHDSVELGLKNIQNQMQALTKEQIQALTKEQIQALTKEQVQALTKEQVQALTDEQVTAFIEIVWRSSKINNVDEVQQVLSAIDQMEPLVQAGRLGPNRAKNLVYDCLVNSWWEELPDQEKKVAKRYETFDAQAEEYNVDVYLQGVSLRLSLSFFLKELEGQKLFLNEKMKEGVAEKELLNLSDGIVNQLFKMRIQYSFDPSYYLVDTLGYLASLDQSAKNFEFVAEVMGQKVSELAISDKKEFERTLAALEKVSSFSVHEKELLSTYFKIPSVEKKLSDSEQCWNAVIESISSK